MIIESSNEVHIFDEAPWDKDAFSPASVFLYWLELEKDKIEKITFYNRMHIIHLKTDRDYYFADMKADTFEHICEIKELRDAIKAYCKIININYLPYKHANLHKLLGEPDAS